MEKSNIGGVEIAANRVAGGFSPPAPTPHRMRVRTVRFIKPIGPPPDNESARRTAFTLSPEPWTLLCCAHSAGSGHPEQSRRVLAYPETGHCMLFLSVGSWICASGYHSFQSLSHSLAFRFAPPPDGSSRFRPPITGYMTCFWLMLMLIKKSINRVHVQGIFIP